MIRVGISYTLFNHMRQFLKFLTFLFFFLSYLCQCMYISCTGFMYWFSNLIIFQGTNDSIFSGKEDTGH